MSIPVEQVFDKLSKSRQKRIRAKADEYIREYKTLQELRKALGLTQSDVAKKQGIKQVNISNLERRSDMLISTLKKYVEALGCELEINIILSDQEKVNIKNLSRSAD